MPPGPVHAVLTGDAVKFRWQPVQPSPEMMVSFISETEESSKYRLLAWTSAAPRTKRPVIQTNENPNENTIRIAALHASKELTPIPVFIFFLINQLNSRISKYCTFSLAPGRENL
jgi:hypothetical protein